MLFLVLLLFSSTLAQELPCSIDLLQDPAIARVVAPNTETVVTSGNGGSWLGNRMLTSTLLPSTNIGAEVTARVVIDALTCSTTSDSLGRLVLH